MRAAWLLLLPALCLAKPLTFTKTVIDPTFRSEGAAVADVNRDGKLDILVGDLWYEAPDWKQHPIRPLGSYNWQNGYSKVFFTFAADIDGDGWPDEIIVDFPNTPARWYENPKGAEGNWKERVIAQHVCNETPLFVDLLGNGKPVPIWAEEQTKQMFWYRPAADLEQEWEKLVIGGPNSPGTQMFSHGLGAGDLNGDGRADVLVKDGWWEAPADRTQGPWTFHKANLGPDCGHLQVYDVNGDGRADVITSSAHNYGVWWWEQNADGSFTQHKIDDKTSQTHSLKLADMDGDGDLDIVTGKRFWAHNGHDPGETEPCVLLWYELQRKDGQVTYVRHEIDTDSGVGEDLTVIDLNGDGKLDVVVSNKKGVHIHVQQ